jgi:hypothetical protein
MPTSFSEKENRVFEQAILALRDFRITFGRELKPDVLAEYYVARELRLQLANGSNTPGYDAVDDKGLRYQIKSRNAQNVDLNNFDFDLLILINLDENYQIKGIWKLTQSEAKTLFVWREKFRKYQTTQEKFKANAQRIR